MRLFSRASWLTLFSALVAGDKDSCPVTSQHLSDPPYENYFFSDCSVDAQVVVTSPVPGSDVSITTPRLIVAWPAGNSGICTFFEPQNGEKGSLAIKLVNSTLGTPLASVHQENDKSDYPFVGVEGVLSLNSSANLTLAILGSVRTIRDYTEGGNLNPLFQDAVKVTKVKANGVQFSRLWLDNTTTTTLSLEPWEGSKGKIDIHDKTASFGPGLYKFSASFNYPQMDQLSPQEVLNKESQSLIEEDPSQVQSLSFFSYTEKLLAGGWRFLTYFGRDSMIAALLLEPVLSTGNSSAMEAVIGAVLERINREDGSVCHEESIGDYATFQNLQKDVVSTDAVFDYHMVDTDYFLPILMARYFNTSSDRAKPLLDTKAGKVNAQNRNLTWRDLSYIGAQKIMKATEAFEKDPSIKNLIQLKDNEGTGQWRDSRSGLGNARIPFDVNCALVPAALYAISELAGMPNVYPDNTDTKTWRDAAAKRAKVWEDKTLPLFQYNITTDKAASLLEEYTSKNNFYGGPAQTESLRKYSSAGKVVDYALAIKTVDSPDKIIVTHTDTAFRLFLINSDDGEQLTTFINATANAILRPFPAGLSTPVGAVVANPALSGDDDLIGIFTNSAYHGTVVWGWQLALMAKGLERQLQRCLACHAKRAPCLIRHVPSFCRDEGVYNALRSAYNHLWDLIADNSDQLQSEVWSWTYSKEGYKFSPLGALTSGTESNVRQLWSLSFLAVKRDSSLAQ
ncbi:hypothetical protein NCS57_00908300 [Fusarium keratoplasticum]|uniref:Uncharacterized protein n=1 Tax=Fusarium keratoplasticum TaxID=1328300 RepID=A0ACC0QVV7_9HYPO|nr:hypothetical protein NCS57_00908300 [Fusarium keratoplasticum]KAI8666814.1 hypothetical protein NCS57_00908300 [Fusarium keratoplasticum]